MQRSFRVSVKMWFVGIVSSLLLACASAQQVASDCPAPNGYFADVVQCDKYYDCQDDVLTEKLCPDGLVFNDLNPRIEKCDFPFQVDCQGRPELQPAVATEGCPRQHGYFPHPDPTVCHQFYYCATGKGSLITCPEGLVFSLQTGNCVWPDVAGRTGCSSKKLLNFTCPTEGFDILKDTHPRYADPDDCQYFYVCINGKDPRRNGCAFGQVFNSVTKACDSPKEVPECADYYTQYFDEYFSTLSSGGGRVTADILAAAISAGYDVPDLKERVRVAGGGTGSSSLRRRGNTPAPPLDSADPETSFGAPARAPSRAPVRAQEQPTRQSPRRPSLRTRPKTTTPAPTTTPPPPPPPAADYAYDYVYEDYPADVVYDEPAPAPVVTTPAPTPAPAPARGRVVNRRPLIRPRS